MLLRTESGNGLGSEEDLGLEGFVSMKTEGEDARIVSKMTIGAYYDANC